MARFLKADIARRKKVRALKPVEVSRELMSISTLARDLDEGLDDLSHMSLRRVEAATKMLEPSQPYIRNALARVRSELFLIAELFEAAGGDTPRGRPRDELCHDLFCAACVIYQECTGALPPATKDPEDGVIRSPFLDVLRSTLRDVIALHRMQELGGDAAAALTGERYGYALRTLRRKNTG